MTIVINTKSYDLASATGTATNYRGPTANFMLKDQLALRVTAPKSTATFAGVARSSAKLTRTLTLSDGSSADAIVELSASIPARAVKADIDALLSDVSVFAASANGNDLVWKHDTNQ